MLKALILISGLINYVSAQGVGAGAGGEVSAGNDDTGASGSVSGSANIDCDLTDGLPSCACLSGSISGSAEGSAGGDAGGSASVSVEPGVNCIDDADGEADDGFTTYRVDVKRDSIMVYNNPSIKVADIDNADTNITYDEEISLKEPLRIRYIQLKYLKNWQIAWKVQEGDEKKSACDDSFPVGTVDYIAYDILNKMIYNEKGCPVAKDSVFTVPLWLKSYEMKFKRPISCGPYSMEVYLVTFWGYSAQQFWFDWEIPEGSNCLPEFEKIE